MSSLLVLSQEGLCNPFPFLEASYAGQILPTHNPSITPAEHQHTQSLCEPGLLGRSACQTGPRRSKSVAGQPTHIPCFIVGLGPSCHDYQGYTQVRLAGKWSEPVSPLGSLCLCGLLRSPGLCPPPGDPAVEGSSSIAPLPRVNPISSTATPMSTEECTFGPDSG